MKTEAPSGALLPGIHSMDTHILRQHYEKNHSFFNLEPAMVVPAMTGVNTIIREYPNDEKAHLAVMVAGFPSLTGDHKVIYVAADRHVTSKETLETAIKLLG